MPAREQGPQGYSVLTEARAFLEGIDGPNGDFLSSEKNASENIRRVQGFYDRLTGVLTSSGITKSNLEKLSDRRFPFIFIGIQGQFFIDLSTPDTIRLTRTVSQNGKHFSYLEEKIHVSANGEAQYRCIDSTVENQLEFTTRTDALITQNGQVHADTIIKYLETLTDNLEESLTNPSYSAQNIKTQVADILYPDLEHYFSGKGTKEDEGFIIVDGLGPVEATVVENQSGRQGILLIEHRPNPVRKWYLLENGNAVVVTREIKDGKEIVMEGHVQIDGGDNNSINHHLVYLELQALALGIKSQALGGAAPAPAPKRERESWKVRKDNHGRLLGIELNPKNFTVSELRRLVRYKLNGDRSDPVGIIITFRGIEHHIPSAKFREEASKNRKARNKFVWETAMDMAYADEVMLVREAFRETP